MESQKNDGRLFLSVCTKIYDPLSKDSGGLENDFFQRGYGLRKWSYLNKEKIYYFKTLQECSKHVKAQLKKVWS